MGSYRQDIVDLLSNGPSSFAALYRFVVQGGADAPVTVRAVMDAIDSLEREGIVHRGLMMSNGVIRDAAEDKLKNAVREYEQWLEPVQGDLAAPDVSLDEVGVWLQLRLGAATNERDPSACWTLDVDVPSGLVTVQAVDEQSGRARLSEWAERNGARLLLDTLRVEAGVECRRAHGGAFLGARVTCELASPASWSRPGHLTGVDE